MRNPFRKGASGEKHVQIVPKMDILEGANKYLKGETYTVDVGLAAYFERNGWLEGDVTRPSPQSVRLDIHDSELGHEARF